MTRDELLHEIAARRPWYQRVDLPEFGISTTDDVENAMIDAAWDNKIGDISLEQAAILRPQPKWAEIRNHLPPMKELEVLEIGSNCGFFSFEFAKLGAARVYGVDVAKTWLRNAEFLRSALKLYQVSFHEGDFMNLDFDGSGPKFVTAGLLSTNSNAVPLPDDKVDIVFTSTVLDHLFFPMFAIYKMIRIARHYVVIDVPVFHWAQDRGVVKLQVGPDGSHHGFSFTVDFLLTYFQRLGIPAQDVVTHLYNEGRSVTFVIHTASKPVSLHGA